MIDFIVHGRPAPQGSKRHVGNGVMVESSKKVKPWREAVKFAALEAMGPAIPYDGPVVIKVSFSFPKPKSAPKKRVTFPDTRSSGDIDKLLRCTFDALVDAGVLTDDARIVGVTAHKEYGLAPGAVITVTKVPL